MDHVGAHVCASQLVQPLPLPTRRTLGLEQERGTSRWQSRGCALRPHTRCFPDTVCRLVSQTSLVPPPLCLPLNHNLLFQDFTQFRIHCAFTSVVSLMKHLQIMSNCPKWPPGTPGPRSKMEEGAALPLSRVHCTFNKIWPQGRFKTGYE